MLHSRLERENETIAAMIRLYCRAIHSQKIGLCHDCGELLQYAAYRINRCPHKEEKPSCAKCQIHCFSLKMQEKIKKVMRFAGPRMIWRHPILSIYHYLDSRRSGALRR